MKELLERLKEKERRGSKPRCHLLTHGPPDPVAARLSGIAAPFATVAASDCWMPRGFADLEEAQLHRPGCTLLPRALSSQLAQWWLPADSQDARTPNFDVASTCTIDGVPGLLLVEAKAHQTELTKEAAGRRLADGDSPGRKASHGTIGVAIELARLALAGATQLPWQISRDSHYQMSNRLAWSWRIASLGMPVVLVYLGFLKASDMSKPGEVPFADDRDWETAVRSHSAPLFPDEIWNRRLAMGKVPLFPLIRSLELPLEIEAGS